MIQISKALSKLHVSCIINIQWHVPFARLVIGWVPRGVATLPDFSSHSKSFNLWGHWYGTVQKGLKFSLEWVTFYCSISTSLTNLKSSIKTTDPYRDSFIPIQCLDVLVNETFKNSLALPLDSIEELKSAGLLKWLVKHHALMVLCSG